MQKIKGNKLLKYLLIITAVFMFLGVVMIASKLNIIKPTGQIKLPKPITTSDTSIEKAITKRRSIRKYKNEAINLNEVSQLLWAGQGTTEKKHKLRSAPSAGALYPIELYLIAGNVENLEPAIYKYNTKEHKIIKIEKGDKRNELCKSALSQESIKNAPASIVICGTYKKTTEKYGSRGKQYLHMEVGAIAQNIYLQAVSLNLGTVFIGAFNDNEVQETINSSPKEIPFAILPIGKTLNEKEGTMGKKGQEIINLDIEKLIEDLNKAYADEWLAYYQYWLGAKLAVGPMRNSVVAELEEHALDELRHAEMLAERIIQLGGTPLKHPEEWFKQTACGYYTPSDPSVKKLLEQNIAGERCAIEEYKKLVDLTKDKDEVTHQMVLEILKDEIEHEEDLESLQEDLKSNS